MRFQKMKKDKFASQKNLVSNSQMKCLSILFLALIGLAIFSLFFSDFLLSNLLPITSGDPAIIYHSRVQVSDWLRLGVLQLWNHSQSLGASLFTSAATKSPFHLSSLFFIFFDDSRLGHIAFVGFQVAIIFVGLYRYLGKELGVSMFIAIFAPVLLLFMPGFRNEFLFNSFGGVALLPFMLIILDRFHDEGGFHHAISLAVLLWLMYVISNIAMVQFSLIYLTIYSLYMKMSSHKRQVSIGRGFIFYFLSCGLFLGLSAYYIFPFLLELLRSGRSHLYSIYASLPLRIWLTSLHFPFTSWIFIDEKMITTGLLTYLESLPLYVNVLLLPCLLIHFSNREAFSREEKFFFAFVSGFMVLSVLNQYVPILGLLVKYTKGTGWHRSAPLFFFSASVCIAIVAEKLYRGKLEIPASGWKLHLFRLYRAHRLALLVIYGGLFVLILAFLGAVKGLDWQGVYPLLQKFTVRPRSHLEFYVARYFSLPIVIYILLVPLGIAVSLFSLEKLRNCEGSISDRRKWAVLLAVSALTGQFSLTRVYYPFNSGVDKARALSEVGFLESLSFQDRIAIVFNQISDIEKRVILDNNLPKDAYGPQVQLLSNRYPELSRFQSNITMHGSFFSSLGVGVYTRGSNFTDKRLDRFHQAVIRKNPYLTRVFSGKKAYLRIGSKDISSQLLDIAGVNYIFSSLPIQNEKLNLVFRGDAYHIYENKQAAPRFAIVHKVRQVQGGDAALEAIQAPGFNFRNEVVVEDAVILPAMLEEEKKSSLSLVSFSPNSVEFIVENSASGFLIFNDAYHPGWRAWVNGKEAKIFRANYVFKGVIVPKGRHKVQFRFIPPGFGLGLIITFATILLLAGVWTCPSKFKEKRSRT